MLWSSQGTIPALAKTADPVISGTTAAMASLTGTDSTWNHPVSITYQWKRDGVSVPFATNATYYKDEDDVGATITRVDSVTSSLNGATSSATSNGIGAIVDPAANVTGISTAHTHNGFNGSSSGDDYIDGNRDGGYYLRVSGSVTIITYYFATSSADYGAYGNSYPATFAEFTSGMKTTTRKILKQLAQCCNIYFIESLDNSTANIRLGMSSTVSGGGGETIAGDIWMQNVSTNTGASLGNRGYASIMHELGHALGLRHSFSPGLWPAMPSDRDAMEFDFMSYRPYVGGSTSPGFNVGSTSYMQSPMAYDIQTLQWIYGTNPRDRKHTYSFNPTTGQMSIDGVAQDAPTGNKILRAFEDHVGHVYDFSSYGSGTITADTAAGHWMTTSATQLPDLGGGHSANGCLYFAPSNTGTPSVILPP